MAYGAILNQTPQIDLSNYVTQEQFSTAISNLNSAVANINGPMTVYTGNGAYAFTAQNAGVYKVYAVAKGGDGGKGYATNYIGGNYASSGAGGGSGGIAVFQLICSVGETISIQITENFVNINNGQVICNSGANGGNGTPTVVPPVGGIGGTVTNTIDVIFKSNGASGENGVVVNSVGIMPGGKGAGVTAVLLYPALHGGKLGLVVGQGMDGQLGSYSQTNQTEKLYGFIPYGGNAGAGADGGNGVLGGNYWNAGTPGKGGPAAVIIEYLGNIT